MKLGQSAFEYILVVGVAMLLIVPGAYLFYNYSVRSGDELTRSRVEAVGNDLVDTAEKVYFIGENSWETLDVDAPDEVRWIYIVNNSELVIEYDSHVGISDAVFFSDVNITTPYSFGGKEYISDISSVESHAGRRLVKISSMGKYVLINETQ